MTPRLSSVLGSLSLAIAAGLAALPAAAQGLRPGGAFLQAGSGSADVQSAGIGVLWPWQWRRSAGGGELSVQTELSLSHWRAEDGPRGHQSIAQVALVPLLRWRPEQGRSPWFVEGGIGLSYTDKLLDTREKTFSTRLNFSDNLALGRSFGAQGQHELSLRLQHTSNAGIKEPNPGLNLWMLRYAARF